MPETIDDLIILGRGVPEVMKDGRITVCLGGFSPSRGFIRLYPTRLRMPIRQWDIICVEVERNNRDTRNESWKIVGSAPYWEQLNQKVEKIGRIESPYERRKIVLDNISPCVETINAAYGSLGIIRPREIHKAYFGNNAQYGRPEQMLLDMFEEDERSWANVKRDFKVEPRLKYTCSECEVTQQFHDQVVIEWGFYEWMRKHPQAMEKVWDNAKIYSDEHEVHLFVGNQANHRTSFIVITVLQIQRNPPPPPPKQLALL